jgi:acetyltransferase-like isoleucine patch superfamily enzyme
MLKKYFSSIILFFIPLKYGGAFLLNILGNNINRKAKVGFSIIVCPNIVLEANTSIGHFNFIKVLSVHLATQAYIGRLNIVKGDIDIILSHRAAIGNTNTVTRPPIGVSYGSAKLFLGILAKYTANHRIDCTQSIYLGDYSTIAGTNCQIWTHGYVHEWVGEKRFRVDGEIHIGNNVYVGSMCVINAGVRIADGITVGSNSCVSKSLLEPGLYVSQALRYIEKTPEQIKNTLTKVEGYDLVEEVYRKQLD